MKYVVAVVFFGLGYVAFDPTAREFIMDQPVWLVIAESALAYAVIGVFVFLEVATAYMREHNQRSPDGDDVGKGVLGGLFWPATCILYVGHLARRSFVNGGMNNVIAAYGRKRRKS